MSIINPKWYQTITSNTSSIPNIKTTINTLPFTFTVEQGDNSIKLVVAERDKIRVLEAFSKFFSENGIDHVVEYYEKGMLVDKVER